MRDLSLVVIKVTNCVVDLRQGNTLRISNFFRVLTRLEEKDNVTYTCTCTFDDRFPTIY